MKKCQACFKEKKLSEFYKDSKQVDELFKKCKQCVIDKTPIPKEINNGYKKCKQCGEERKLELYRKAKKGKFGTVPVCKICMNLPAPKPTGKYKTCTLCSKEKDLHEFSKDKYSPDGYTYACLLCRKNNVRVELEDISDGHKTCSKCNKRKPFSKFYKSNQCRGGVESACIKCNKEWSKEYRSQKHVKEKLKQYRDSRKEETKVYLKQYYQDNKEYYESREKIPVPNNRKVCCTCKKEKHISNFSGKKTNIDGYMRRCKSCVADHCKNTYHLYKGKWLKWQNKYRRQKRQEDELYYIMTTIRSRIKYYLKDKKHKVARIHDILECSTKQFRKHIESQFLDWMTWDNYGLYNGDEKYGWDLDHIIPISKARSTEELYKLSHWSNFQPLCSAINRKVKKNKVPKVCNIELQETFPKK